jgi:uncharacterized protein (TIGR02679 family)
MTPDNANKDRLHRLLGPPALSRLRERLRRRLERGRSLGGTLTLTDASADERRAIESLLGRRPGTGRNLTVDLDALDAMLQRSAAAPDLASAVEALTGPVVDRRAAEQRDAEAWAALWQQAEPAAQARDLGVWLAGVRADGLLRRLAGDAETAAALLHQVWHVADALPAGGLALSTFAARQVGDAHGLDPGRPLATLVRRVLTARYPDVGEDSDDAHTLWAAAGVRIGGGLTSRVAVLNLPASPDTATGRSLASLNARAEPAWLTLRQLLDDAPAWSVAGACIHVCENIAVVAEAADRLGAAAAPLVATDGQPSGATVVLLRALRAAGAQLAYHGDFDWGGVHIGNRVIGDLGARPWRFDAAAYRAALAKHAGRDLEGRPAEARWDSDLAPAMRYHARALDEERLIATLVADLDPTRAAP